MWLPESLRDRSSSSGRFECATATSYFTLKLAMKLIWREALLDRKLLWRYWSNDEQDPSRNVLETPGTASPSSLHLRPQGKNRTP